MKLTSFLVGLAWASSSNELAAQVKEITDDVKVLRSEVGAIKKVMGESSKGNSSFVSVHSRRTCELPQAELCGACMYCLPCMGSDAEECRECGQCQQCMQFSECFLQDFEHVDCRTDEARKCSPCTDCIPCLNEEKAKSEECVNARCDQCETCINDFAPCLLKEVLSRDADGKQGDLCATDAAKQCAKHEDGCAGWKDWGPRELRELGDEKPQCVPCLPYLSDCVGSEPAFLHRHVRRARRDRDEDRDEDE